MAMSSNIRLMFQAVVAEMRADFVHIERSRLWLVHFPFRLERKNALILTPSGSRPHMGSVSIFHQSTEFYHRFQCVLLLQVFFPEVVI